MAGRPDLGLNQRLVSVIIKELRTADWSSHPDDCCSCERQSVWFKDVAAERQAAVAELTNVLEAPSRAGTEFL
jgi:hypothetical protein